MVLGSKGIYRQLQQTPGVAPQAIPLPNYERIPFTACWDRLSGVFQRCVETILEYMVFSRKYKRIQMILYIYIIYYISYTESLIEHGSI